MNLVVDGIASHNDTDFRDVDDAGGVDIGLLDLDDFDGIAVYVQRRRGEGRRNLSERGTSVIEQVVPIPLLRLQRLLDCLDHTGKSHIARSRENVSGAPRRPRSGQRGHESRKSP